MVCISMNDSNLKIYVMTHKKADVLSDDVYTPLLLGACNHEDNYGYLCDNVGENISDKNSSYCELTGLYWLWKHSDADYVGLVHYRRYFINGFLGDYLSKEDVFRYLKDYDIIVPIKSKSCGGSVIEEAIRFFISQKDLDKVREIILEIYPDYINDFDNFINGHEMHCNCMFISSKKLIDEYCEWIFTILGELEKNIDLSEYEGNRARLFGYFAEFLFNVWTTHNNLKIKYNYVNFTEGNGWIIRLIQRFPNSRCFLLKLKNLIH